MTLSTCDEVLVESRDRGLVWITIQRPHKHNALARPVLAAVASAVRRAAEDPATRCVLVTGAGDKYFAAGGDLVDLMSVRSEAEVADMVEAARGALDALRDCPVPTVALLNGDAIGGGAELALACDLRLQCDHARIGYVQGRLAITPAWGGGTDLIALVGPARALRMATRCDMVDAPTALAWGLAEAVIGAGDARESDIAAFLQPLLDRAPQVLRGLKAQTRAWRRAASWNERRALEQQHLSTTWRHDDHWRVAERILSKEKQ
jgi:enoyl-CoA hydratase/carnithine racemase